MDIRMKQEGLEELSAAISALPALLEEEVFRHGLAAGAEVFQKQLILVAPRYKKTGPNRLHKNIRVRRRRKRFRGVALARARGRPTKARQFFRGAQVRAAVPHAHLVEFGHGGPAPAPAHPFIRPLLDNGGVQNLMLDAVVRESRRRYAIVNMARLRFAGTPDKDIIKISRRVARITNF